MDMRIPDPSLVVLIGPAGSGKSTFARRHFRPTEVLSSDACRAMVSDDESNQSASGAAFAILHFIAARRLGFGRLTVVDATNVLPKARKVLVSLAGEFHCLAVAIVFDLPEDLCQERSQRRTDRALPPHVVAGHCVELRRSLPGLEQEGFARVFVLRSPEEVDAATVTRVPRHGDGPDELATPAP